MLIMELRKQLCVDCSCPPVVSVLYTTKIEPKKIFPFGFVLVRVKQYAG
jgi:hypothetical protein